MINKLITKPALEIKAFQEERISSVLWEEFTFCCHTRQKHAQGGQDKQQESFT